MLVLSRKTRESVVIGGINGVERLLKVTVLRIRGGKVRLGFEVDENVPIYRLEAWKQLCAGGQPSMPKRSPAAANEPLEQWEDDGGATELARGGLTAPPAVVSRGCDHA